MTRIAMWSGPRNISTALMRSFENRTDCVVTDEPFYAHFLHKTGTDHPLREEIIKSRNTDWKKVVDEITGPIPGGKNIWYQKHMAQHNLPVDDLNWVEKLKNCILIRHPKEVMLSYLEKYEIKSENQLGYHQQRKLYAMLESLDKAPFVLDAADILKDPEGMLKKLCKKLTIPFYNEMLSWPAGSRGSDGIWGRHWYGNVEASTEFQPNAKKKGKISSKYQYVYSACMESYEKLYSDRLQ